MLIKVKHRDNSGLQTATNYEVVVYDLREGDVQNVFWVNM
jgi:hypothetical protein